MHSKICIFRFAKTIYNLERSESNYILKHQTRSKSMASSLLTPKSWPCGHDCNKLIASSCISILAWILGRRRSHKKTKCQKRNRYKHISRCPYLRNACPPSTCTDANGSSRTGALACLPPAPAGPAQRRPGISARLETSSWPWVPYPVGR